MEGELSRLRADAGAAALLAAERGEEQEVVLRRVRDEVGMRLYD